MPLRHLCQLLLRIHAESGTKFLGLATRPGNIQAELCRGVHGGKPDAARVLEPHDPIQTEAFKHRAADRRRVGPTVEPFRHQLSRAATGAREVQRGLDEHAVDVEVALAEIARRVEAVAAQAQARLLLDVGQNHHVRALPAAGGTAAEGPQAAWTDIHHPA